MAAQQAQNKRYVLVAQGLYRENVRLFDGAQVFGGYSQDFLKRDPKLYTTTWEGVAPTGTAIAPVHGESLGAAGAVRETVVVGFVIAGWDATDMAVPGANGEASIGVFLRDVGPRFVLQTNDVIAGRGGAGGRGSTGTQGFGRQAGTTLNGQRGQNSTFFPNGMCTAINHRTGAIAGTNAACAVANGTPGGNVVCPIYTFTGNQGTQQMYQLPLPTSRDGAGGFDWSFDNLSSPGCNHVTESGFPTSIQQHDGQDGKQGSDGTGGAGRSGRGESGALRQHRGRALGGRHGGGDSGPGGPHRAGRRWRWRGRRGGALHGRRLPGAGRSAPPAVARARVAVAAPAVAQVARAAPRWPS